MSQDLNKHFPEAEPYRWLRVTGRQEETADVFTLYLQPEDNRPLSYRAGQFLTLLFRQDGEEQRRSYSFSSSPVADNSPAITIKKVVHGEISNFLYRHIQAGDRLKALPATGRFTLDTQPDNQRDIFLIAAGSGITPVFSLLKTLLLEEPQSHITLIYSNRNEQTTVFYQQLNALARQYADRFTCLYIFSDPINKQYPYRAHLNPFLLEQLIPAQLRYAREKAVFFLCGPFPFMRMAYYVIAVMGFSKESIHRENFVIRTEQEILAYNPVTDPSDKTVSIQYAGKTFQLLVPYGKSIVRAALDQGIYLPYSCMAGMCGSCAARCRQGEVIMSVNEVLTDKETADGWVLTCVGYPATHDAAITFQ